MVSNGCGGVNYQTTPLINDLLKAVNDEYQAIEDYTRLAEMAPSPEERTRILEIRQDEIRHYDTVLNFYHHFTEVQPKLTRAEACPQSYRKGLQAAFKDEQETADFYRKVAGKAESRYVREAFLHAALDEQNHAVWFAYFYFQHGCRK